MRAKTGRNILIALLLSLFLTLVLGAFYTFYPVILLILASLWNRIASSQQDSNGIAAVAGGVSESFLMVLVVVAPILFFIIFALLQKRTMKN
jgi:H+/Cl- antiporter ClcA